MTTAPKRVLDARSAVRRLLQDHGGFVGTGVGLGSDGYEVLVLVEDEDCEAARKAPREWMGVRVRVEVGGIPRARTR